MSDLTFHARFRLERPDEPEATELELTGERLIGRKPPADVVIPIGQMSSRHLWVRVGPGRVMIEDAGSSSGTFVEGQLIRGEVEVAREQRIAFGGVTMVLVEHWSYAVPDLRHLR